MGLFAAVRRLWNLTATDPKSWDETLWRFRGASVAGENVTESTALTYSAVWNAVTLISGTVASLPLNLLSSKGPKTNIQDGLPAHRVLHTAANELMTAMQFREVQMAHVLLWGNAYAEIVRDGYGNVVALWPITPDRVSVALEDGDLVYKIRVGNLTEPLTLPRDRVLHVAGLGFDGFTGYSVVGMARKSIGLGLAMETFGSSYFANGMHPSAVISHPGRLSDDGHKRLKDGLNEAYSGLGNAQRMMLLEDAMKIEKLPIQPEESQFLESRQFQIPEIARWFNLPPHKLKDLTRSSFSNIEQEQISFVTDSILPWLVRLEATYNAQLLTPLEQRRLYYKHIVEGLMRGSAADRAAFYARLWGLGAMSINEIRDKEDMDPIEGGDTYFVPANMVPLERALNPPEPPPPQLPPANGADDADGDRDASPDQEPGNGRADIVIVPVSPRSPERITAHAN